jgi:hypothetical protein
MSVVVARPHCDLNIPSSQTDANSLDGIDGPLRKNLSGVRTAVAMKPLMFFLSNS